MASVVLVVLLALLAVLPGCGCGDDAPRESLFDDRADPCAPPPVGGSDAVSFAQSVRFLYDGACPRQTGVDKGVFDDFRVSVIRGRVVGEDGAPLSGVRVHAPKERRYGETRTREDGGFDFVVNGAARTRLRFELEGRLLAMRNAEPKANRFFVLNEVALVQKSATATPLSFGGGGWQVATGDLSKDESAERRVRLLVPPGTKASAVKTDGSRQTLTDGTLRITEFTRGARGPAAMPSELPPASGYTYASSFLLDEAGPDARVEFESPVIAYLDNFLGMKPGASVPSGALEEGDDGWRAQASGRVVKLVSGGAPSLDANGDDKPDSPAELAALGITPEELSALAGAAPTGVYFRVPMSHFSAWDFNWGFGPPDDSAFPPAGDGDGFPDLPCITSGGSYFECERQTLAEDIPLVGTGIGLHYHSDRVDGYRGNSTFTVPVTEATVPASVKYAEVEISVLGVTETKTYPAAPNLSHTFTWSGRDAYGRAWPGETVAEVRVGLVYDGIYTNTRSFGAFGDGEAITAERTRKEITLNRRYEFRLGAFHEAGRGLGGWSLSAHHVYDPASRTLYRGDGGRRNSDGIGATVRGFAGVPRYGSGGGDAPEVPVAEAHFGLLTGLAFDEAGALYVAESTGTELIRKIDKGVVATFAGTGPAGHTGEGGPARQAQINYPRGIAAMRDGRICFSEFYEDSVRCVGTDGVLRTLAGGGTKDIGVQPVPALEAKLTRPGELAEGPDGSLFVTLNPLSIVVRIDRAGTVELAVGSGQDAGENVPAQKVALLQPRGLAVAPDGALFIAEAGRHRIRRVDPSGRVTTYAGSGDAGNSGDGGPAASATFRGPTAVALDAEGGLFVADIGNARIRRVDRGKVQAFAGGGDRPRGPGSAARLASVTAAAMAVARDGTLYAVNEDDHTVLTFAAPFPGGSAGDLLVPSDDGSELYVFDGHGRHLRTLDGLTSQTVQTLSYDPSGRLIRIEDRHGNAIVVTRDEKGRATRLTAPFGQVTTLGYDAAGWLAEVTDPIGRREAFSYELGGLLAQRTDAGGGVHAMAYDALGRLTRDATAENASFTLASDGKSSSVTTGLGRREAHTFRAGPGRDEIRTFQDADGTITTWTLRRDGTANVTFPNGTIIDVTREADPRLGMLVPYAAKHVVRLPSGLSRSVSQAWTAQLGPTGALLELKGERTTTDGRSATLYDAQARVITSTSVEGRVTKQTLDAEGRLVHAEVPGRAPVTFTYDERGRVVATDQGGRVSRTFYDPQTGALARVENALGQAVTLEHDAALRLTGVLRADGAKSALAWSAMDDLVGLTPPGKPQHVMAFGKDGNESSYTAPGSAPVGFSYDVDRALSGVTREDGAATSLGYDAAGRVTSVTYPGGPLGIGYDATGQVRTLIAPGSSLSFGFDGLLLHDITATGPAPGTVTFTYDEMLRRSTEQAGSSTVAYRYDRDGLLVRAGAASVTRESASGQLSGIDVFDAQQRFTHTPFGELATYQARGPAGLLLDVQLTYDVLSRVVQRAENGVTWAYDYDVRGRLTRVRRDGAEHAAYAYDANGNRTDGGAMSDGQDRITNKPGAVYTYSAAGERITRTATAGLTRYGYDGRGHLAWVELPGGVRADYDLDAFGRRITKRRNGTVQNRFLYRNALQPAAEVDAQGAVLSRYVYARGELGPDVLEREGTTYMLAKDERGSIRFVVDATTGAVAQALEYDAFGRVLSDTNPGFQPFGFAGGIYDPDTGLVHFGAREYDPETGSFTRKDPSRFGGGENLYAYAGGDPINFVDPNGESIVGVLAGGGEGAAIGYAEEGARQVLDPSFSGFDCGALRSAAGWGAFGGALGGAVSGAAKSAGRQCFAAGTEVATERGSVAIEDVAVGDRVLSRAENGELSYQQVTHLFRRADAEQVALTFTDATGAREPIVTTPEHPFRVATGEWVPAGRLNIGDNVVTAEGGLATLSAALSLEKRGTVYNFEVAGTHTYFVGSSHLWVHNACKPRSPGPTTDRATGRPVGRFIVDAKGNTMIEPAGGSTVAAGRGGGDTHTTYPNGSNYQRLNPTGHGPNGTPHGHGHMEGTGPGKKGQGPSIDPLGNIVPWNSSEAHWKID